ncbi:MAG TPA: type VI secretion system accessory protein TagJ [Pirellulales bacterium]|jgi:type VI secretion system protein ImpE|nr:type VI secretion system accessory protein TagJ [Pirellulales bacterium]
MSAEQSLRDGDLAATLAQLKLRVRDNPADAKHRVFLFQLQAVLGDWQRALDQLNVLSELDALALPMVQTYREVIQCELLRAEIFAGNKSPLLLGEPEPWIAWLLQSLQAGAQGKREQAAELRERAFDAAEASTGSVNDQPFQWLADADSRLGPVLEVMMNGRYYWVPFTRISKIDIEKPADLRDVVWMPAQFTWSTGGETVGFIPTRYPGSEACEDNAVRLGRKTIWQGEEGEYLGLGQRVLASDEAEYSLMDVREIRFDCDPPSEAETADG